VDRILTYVLCYPRLKEAYIHHNACNVGTNDLLSKQREIEMKLRNSDSKDLVVCNCCGTLGQNELLEKNVDLDELNLGIGVTLFFKNYFFHFIIFILMFLIYSLYAIGTNVTVYNQNSGSFLCSQNMTCSLAVISGGSKVVKLLNYVPYSQLYCKIQSWIGVGFVILWGFLYIIKTIKEDKYVINL
jgi:hypothetical protein